MNTDTITASIPDWVEVIVWVAIAVTSVVAAFHSVAKVRGSVTRWARENVREVVAEETGPLQDALMRHMDDEIQLRQEDAADRHLRQLEHIEFREEMRRRMDAIESALIRHRWPRWHHERNTP